MCTACVKPSFSIFSKMHMIIRARICEPFWSRGIDSQPLTGRHDNPILRKYRPARLHRLAESIPWNRFLGSFNVCKFGLIRCL
jgi:hypothetical protein